MSTSSAKVPAASADLEPVTEATYGEHIRVHIGWAHVGCVWQVVRREGETVHLVTPTSRKRRTERLGSLYHTRSETVAIRNQRAREATA